MNSIPEYWKPYLDMLKEIWYDVDNPEEEIIAREVSPVYHIDKIKALYLLFRELMIQELTLMKVIK